MQMKIAAPRRPTTKNADRGSAANVEITIKSTITCILTEC